MSFAIGEKIPSDFLLRLAKFYLVLDAELEISTEETRIKISRNEEKEIEMHIFKIDEECLKKIPPHKIIDGIDSTWKYVEILPKKESVLVKLFSKKYEQLIEREISYPIVLSPVRKRLMKKIITAHERWELNARQIPKK
ncbi:MAG: hypothetical protein ACP6IS_10650 [Candidatus Asgardarchaeia archaeon]